MDTAQVEQMVARQAFPAAANPPELISTHISWVILTDAFAYKIKKPVQFSFLDFSTLERRHHFCQQELALNQRLAPQVYLDLQTIRETPDGPEIGGEQGPIIDYAVRMQRIDSSKQMNLLLAEKAVTAPQIIDLAQQIVHFHRQLTPLQQIVDLDDWRHTFNDLEAIRDTVIQWGMSDTADLIDRGLQFSDHFLERYGQRLLDREKEGWIVEGHGDLHAKNIFLTQPPVVFDCIEFSEELRQLDVLNEIAFFCMDMDAYGQPELGRLFLQAYVDQIPCMPLNEDRLIFDYFKLYRANVRLKVNGLRGKQATTSADTQQWQAQVHTYSALFHNYLTKLKQVF